MAEQSGHPESSQGPSDFCTVYSQMLYQLSYSRNDIRLEGGMTLTAGNWHHVFCTTWELNELPVSDLTPVEMQCWTQSELVLSPLLATCTQYSVDFCLAWALKGPWPRHGGSQPATVGPSMK